MIGTARAVDGSLAELNAADLLDAGDVRIAVRLSDLACEPDPQVRLALALAVWWVRAGSTCLDLAEVAPTLGVRTPEPHQWLDRVAASPLVTAPTPVLRVDEGLVYLDRYHELEVALCRDLQARLTPAAQLSPVVEQAIDRLFPTTGDSDQRAAARRAAELGTLVLTGGPGTGKTTTVGRLLAVLNAQSWQVAGRPVDVALVAPTGKAAARLRESIARTCSQDAFTAEERTWLSNLPSSTIHRLLGRRDDSSTRFLHDRSHRLPHDVVVVDEASMAALSLMTALVESLRPECRLILVGDADQLAPVESGAVLHDVVDGWAGRPGSPVTRLTHNHRFGDVISTVASAVRDGDARTALALMNEADSPVRLVPADAAEAVVRESVLPVARELVTVARRGDRGAALALLARHQLLCARRSGPAGVSTWNDRIERWLRDEGLIGFGPWFAGRPVLMTTNDAPAQVFNGDSGVTLSEGNRLVVAIDGTTVRSFAPSRLVAPESAFAMTIHRSQGSQFTDVTVMLPTDDSRLMTRELLYTALTRAENSVTIIGTEESIRTAMSRRVPRSSGIARRLAR